MFGRFSSFCFYLSKKFPTHEIFLAVFNPYKLIISCVPFIFSLSYLFSFLERLFGNFDHSCGERYARVLHRLACGGSNAFVFSFSNYIIFASFTTKNSVSHAKVCRVFQWCEESCRHRSRSMTNSPVPFGGGVGGSQGTANVFTKETWQKAQCLVFKWIYP